MTSDSPHFAPRAVAVSNQCHGLSVDEEELAQLFQTLDRYGSFDAPTGELSLAFVTEEEISRLHEQFMADASPTDVITFPGDAEFDLAGDICVCPAVARRYAEEHGAAFAEELTLYLVHGYLHLCGFDDVEDADREAMRKAEEEAMAILQRHGAMPSFRFE